MRMTIVITGMPRSGTSWLGQIFDSDPRILLRTEPLFAYRFKDTINIHSSCREIREFLTQVEVVEDHFILQKGQRESGIYPTFQKEAGDLVAIKTTRHYELLERYLHCIEKLAIFALIRHPCGAINSWINTNREFLSKGCIEKRDWRSGACRKIGSGEYWGFEDWLISTKKFVSLEKKWKNFYTVRYKDLVDETLPCVNRLFKTLGIEVQRQTIRFLAESQARHDDNPYSVFKDPSVVTKWEDEMDSGIAQEIIVETENAGLQHFLE